MCRKNATAFLFYEIRVCFPISGLSNLIIDVSVNIPAP